MTLSATLTADEVGAAFTAQGIAGVITGCFGRTDSVHREPHAGLDVVFPADAGIPALCGGTVVFASDADDGSGWAAIFGTSRVIDHGDGTRALYAHMRAGTGQFAVGDVVRVGQILGVQGTTGFSTGDHLHLGLSTDANPFFSKDGDGGVSRLLNPADHLDAGAVVTESAGLIAGPYAEPSARDLAEHAAQYVADAALRLRQAIHDGGGAFVVGINADLLVARATEVRDAAKAL